MKYEAAKLEITAFAAADVIEASDPAVTPVITPPDDGE